MVKNLCFYFRGHGLIHGRVTKVPHAVSSSPPKSTFKDNAIAHLKDCSIVETELLYAQKTKIIQVTLVIFTLLFWSVTKPVISLRYA